MMRGSSLFQKIKIEAPFTRYNLLSNQLSNPLYNPVWQPVVSCKLGMTRVPVPRCCIHKSSTVLLTYRLYWPSAINKLKHEVGSESSNNEARRPAPFAHREANTTSMRRKWLTVLYRRRRSVFVYSASRSRKSAGERWIDSTRLNRRLSTTPRGTRPPAHVSVAPMHPSCHWCSPSCSSRSQSPTAQVSWTGERKTVGGMPVSECDPSFPSWDGKIPKSVTAPRKVRL